MARNEENAKRLRKEWYERNKELTKERARAWVLANPEKAAQSKTKWRENNIETHNAINREWFAKNRPKRAAYEGKRRAAQLQRTPKWLTADQLKVIDAFYQIAAMLTKHNGEEWHVDHVIPLQGKSASGLHTPANLQLLPASENSKKSNKFHI